MNCFYKSDTIENGRNSMKIHAKYKQKNECRRIISFDFVQSLIQAGFEVLVSLPSFKVLLKVLGFNSFA